MLTLLQQGFRFLTDTFNNLSINLMNHMGFYKVGVSKQTQLGFTVYLWLESHEFSDDKISAEVGLLAEDSQDDFMSLCYHWRHHCAAESLRL